MFKVDKQLSIPTSPTAAANLSVEEKMEVDARSVYIGRNISNHYTTTTHSTGNKVSQGCKIREMILLNWGGKIG